MRGWRRYPFNPRRRGLGFGRKSSGEPGESWNFVRRTERITPGRIGEALDTEKVSHPDFAEPEPRFEAGFFRLVPLSAAESYAE
jgi:hypothetical protein